MNAQSDNSQSHSLLEEQKELGRAEYDSDGSKEMNVEDDELDCPNPEIHTLQKSQASFVPIECLQSQADRRELVREVFGKYAETSIETAITSLKKVKVY